MKLVLRTASDLAAGKSKAERSSVTVFPIVLDLDYITFRKSLDTYQRVF